MTGLRLAVLVLPGGDLAAASGTLADVKAETAAGVDVLALDGTATAVLDGVRAADPEAVVAAADVLAFVRAGDRWRPGALADRLRVFEGRDSGLGLAAHVLVGPDGSEVLTVRPSFSPPDPAEFVLRPSVEAAAVLARTSALGAEAVALLARPHADASVWSTVARRSGVVSTGVIAADILLDRERHGSGSPRHAAALFEAAVGPGVDAPGGSTIRREFLRRRYLDGPSDASPVDLVQLLDGSTERADAVVADLEWALERQSEALVAERLPWAEGEMAPKDQVPSDLRPSLHELSADIAWLHREVQRRDREAQRLHAEVARRDATIERLQAERGLA